MSNALISYNLCPRCDVFQDRDYEPVSPGQPIFLKANGEEVFFEGEKETFPIFINEAAYYENGVAFIFTQRLSFDLPRLVVRPSTTDGGSP